MSNKNLADKFKKISSVEELAHCVENGLEVICPSVTYLEKPKKAEAVMGMSVRSVLTLIRKGMYAKGVELGAPTGSLLAWAQKRVASTGLSHSEIAEMVGCKRQEVGRFMSAKSVQTRTLDRFMKELGL